MVLYGCLFILVRTKGGPRVRGESGGLGVAAPGHLQHLLLLDIYNLQQYFFKIVNFPNLSNRNENNIHLFHTFENRLPKHDYNSFEFAL